MVISLLLMPGPLPMQTEVLNGIAEDVEREALQRQQAAEKKQVLTF